MTIKEQAQQSIQNKLEKQRLDYVEASLKTIKYNEKKISELRKEIVKQESIIEDIEKISLEEFNEKYNSCSGCTAISSTGYIASYPCTFTN